MSIASVAWPTGWRTVPLWSMFRRVKDVGHPDEEMLSVYREHGVVRKESRDDNFNKTAENRNIYQLVDDGWLIVNRMKAWQGSLGISPYRGIVSGHYICFEPTHHEDSRFLNYLLRSSVYTVTLQQMSRGVRPNQIEIDNDELRALPLHLPGLTEQRAIADYLDAETARIDALIAKKQQLIHLLEERRETAFDKALERFGVRLPDDLDPHAARSISLPAGWRMVKLSSALRQLTNGYVGPTRDILVDEGIRYIQGLHVKRGAIDFDRRPFFVTEPWHRAHPRTSLRPGDVVIVQTGDIGQCAVVPDDFGEANCHALLIARANENVTDGQYLATYLQCRFGRYSLLRLATGALHPHLEFGIRDAPLLLPPRAKQFAVVNAVADETMRLDATAASVGRQIDLLVEHRQALLTAAVTGGMPLPTGYQPATLARDQAWLS